MTDTRLPNHTDLTAAAAALSAHPWVARVDTDDIHGEGEHGLRIVVTDESVATTRAAGSAIVGGLTNEHLTHWTEVYDWTYSTAQQHDSDDDLAGWRATDTGEPLPAEHMTEWVERTVDLVLAQHPRNILELGCGTGLLMRRLAPHVERYVGTDVAGDVVERLSAQGIAGTSFVKAGAHELRGQLVQDAVAATGAVPDCILLNSVTQCFPDTRYLAAVVLDAIDYVASGGTVIVGDIRHSGQLLDFARWAETAKNPDGDPGTLDNRVAHRAATDSELSVDPSTLASIASASGREVSVLTYAKTLQDDSELTRYRFDAVFTVDAPAEGGPPAVTSWQSLDRNGTGLTELRGHVESGPTLVAGIPRSVTAAALRSALTGTDAVVLIDPTDTAVFRVASPPGAGAIIPADPPATGVPHEPLGAFARSRMLDVARTVLRRAGITRPAGMRVELPSGRGLDIVAATRRRREIDRAGRCAVSGTPEPIIDAALARVPGAIERLDAIALSALTGFLHSDAGVCSGVPVLVDEVASTLRVADRHRWILRRWIEVLCEQGHGSMRGADTFVLGDSRTASNDADDRELARACRSLGYPSAMAEFYSTALSSLGPLLRDEMSAQAMMFPDGDMTTSLSKDENNISNRYLHGAAAAVIAEAARTRPGPLRILELGGGAGGGTQAALAALGDRDIDYLFTDISRFFTTSAADRFGDRPGFRTAIADIDVQLTAQGLEARSFDVVVAANVLHCAKDAAVSVAALSDMLAPSGIAVVIEAVREHYLVLLTMQFLLSPRNGALHPGKLDRRRGSVFLSGADIQHYLSVNRIRPSLDLPEEGTPLAAPSQRLYVGQTL
ncbi:class I SAM-dependent methyltransferase [Rhodococcus sp. H29-C3]|uniref:class I SAM-dependent methyltransferase n=1 Tax=Rhodococcus sp. H29-C3 TaxID=3046307 RepID=UPI0024BA0502|nr:class I SAM-dependent methyltransferase [Rhodococcus sp. H29-C3]MDJ0363082.1 class I SAM-dependent methyltransferase [Rhodococcus sp. H29-C3]